MKQFKSAGQAQRLLSAPDQINNLFRLRRDHVTAAGHRASRTQTFQVWAEICSMQMSGCRQSFEETRSAVRAARRAPSTYRVGSAGFSRLARYIRNLAPTHSGVLWDESQKFYPLVGGTPQVGMREWRWPRGGKIKFSHFQFDSSLYDWQGAQIALICFDAPATGSEIKHGHVVEYWIHPSHARADGFDQLGLSRRSFHQVNMLARPEDDPLAGFEIPGYCPQPESHVERIDAHSAPESLFTELVLQRVTVGAHRYGIAIRRLHSRAGVGSRAHMRRLRGGCFTADDAGKPSDKG